MTHSWQCYWDGSCHECVILTLSVQCYWWFRVVSWVCDIDSFSTVLLVILGPLMSVSYKLFQYSVIGDAGSCHECVILTLSVQCYWWFRVVSWVCHIDSFSTVLLVIQGPVLSVSYWLFQYSVIGDSRSPSLSVSYWLFQYSVIGDSGSSHECVILTLSVQCYWWFRVLSWVCDIDSFSTVLLVIQDPVWVCHIDSFSTVLLVIPGHCHECVILTLSVQCYWWFRVLSWVCHIDSFSTVLLVITGPVMSVSYWLFQYSVIGDQDPVMSVWYWLFQYSVIGDSGSCHECVILTLSVQCYWWFRILSWVYHIDSFTTVLLVIPGPVMRSWYWPITLYWWNESYWLFQYSVIGDSMDPVMSVWY